MNSIEKGRYKISPLNLWYGNAPHKLLDKQTTYSCNGLPIISTPSRPSGNKTT